MWEMGIYSAFAPLALLVLSSVWAYPAVLEEVVKWWILTPTRLEQVPYTQAGLVVGLSFGVSEAVLFMMNAWVGGQWVPVLLRLCLTVPMHTLTAVVVALGVQRRRGWLGLCVAMVLHAGFNYWVG